MTSTVVGQGKEATVLVTKNPNQSLWESILPECCRALPPELARMDALLDDVAFFEPVEGAF